MNFKNQVTIKNFQFVIFNWQSTREGMGLYF